MKIIHETVKQQSHKTLDRAVDQNTKPRKPL